MSYGLREFQHSKNLHVVQSVPTIAEMLNHFTMPNNEGRVKGFTSPWHIYYSEYISLIAMATKLTEPEEIKATNYKIAQRYIMMIQMWKTSVVENGLWY